MYNLFRFLSDSTNVKGLLFELIYALVARCDSFYDWCATCVVPVRACLDKRNPEVEAQQVYVVTRLYVI
jgi:hypothetical protein